MQSSFLPKESFLLINKSANVFPAILFQQKRLQNALSSNAQHDSSKEVLISPHTNFFMNQRLIRTALRSSLSRQQHYCLLAWTFIWGLRPSFLVWFASVRAYPSLHILRDGQRVATVTGLLVAQTQSHCVREAERQCWGLCLLSYRCVLRCISPFLPRMTYNRHNYEGVLLLRTAYQRKNLFSSCCREDKSVIWLSAPFGKQKRL